MIHSNSKKSMYSFQVSFKKSTRAIKVVRILFLSAILLMSNYLNSQSLIRNGDFESHTEFTEGFTPFIMVSLTCVIGGHLVGQSIATAILISRIEQIPCSR